MSPSQPEQNSECLPENTPEKTAENRVRSPEVEVVETQPESNDSQTHTGTQNTEQMMTEQEEQEAGAEQEQQIAGAEDADAGADEEQIDAGDGQETGANKDKYPPGGFKKAQEIINKAYAKVPERPSIIIEKCDRCREQNITCRTDAGSGGLRACIACRQKREKCSVLNGKPRASPTKAKKAGTGAENNKRAAPKSKETIDTETDAENSRKRPRMEHNQEEKETKTNTEMVQKALLNIVDRKMNDVKEDPELMKNMKIMMLMEFWNEYKNCGA